jgi:heme-degrading monooxygenase HmoA
MAALTGGKGGGGMYARVVRVSGQSGQADMGRRHIEEQVIPKLRGMAGFRDAYWLRNRQTGAGLTVLLFETEEAMQAATKEGQRIREDASKQMGFTIEGVDEYEVFAST